MLHAVELLLRVMARAVRVGAHDWVSLLETRVVAKKGRGNLCFFFLNPLEVFLCANGSCSRHRIFLYLLLGGDSVECCPIFVSVSLSVLRWHA